MSDITETAGYVLKTSFGVAKAVGRGKRGESAETDPAFLPGSGKGYALGKTPEAGADAASAAPAAPEQARAGAPAPVVDKPPPKTYKVRRATSTLEPDAQEAWIIHAEGRQRDQEAPGVIGWRVFRYPNGRTMQYCDGQKCRRGRGWLNSARGGSGDMLMGQVYARGVAESTRIVAGEKEGRKHSRL